MCPNSPLLCSHETLPRVVPPVLGSPSQKGHGDVGVAPEEGHEDGRDWSTSPVNIDLEVRII